MKKIIISLLGIVIMGSCSFDKSLDTMDGKVLYETEKINLRF